MSHAHITVARRLGDGLHGSWGELRPRPMQRRRVPGGRNLFNTQTRMRVEPFASLTRASLTQTISPYEGKPEFLDPGILTM